MKEETVSVKTGIPSIRWKAEKAATDPNVVLYTRVHYIDEDLLKHAFRQVSKDTAPGIDGETVAEYAEDVQAHLRDVHERLTTKHYRASSSTRVWIAKDDGSQRPRGLLVVEDTIVHKAVAILLEDVFESDVSDVSSGFRPSRTPHQALHAVRELIRKLNIGWIVDVDVQQCFDTVDREVFFELLHTRVKDGGLDRLLNEWFEAGVLDGEDLSYSDKGTPQGGVVLPVMANMYLHCVLDAWFEREVKPRLKGRSVLRRFADDAVLGFEYEEDALRVREALLKRLEKSGLNAPPVNTRLVTFIRPAYGAGKDRTNKTFDFLGFTHYWAKSRRGNWVVTRRTRGTRRCRAISRCEKWCKDHRHLPVKEQWQSLSRKLRGYYQYYGIRGNYDSVYWVYDTRREAWRRW